MEGIKKYTFSHDMRNRCNCGMFCEEDGDFVKVSSVKHLLNSAHQPSAGSGKTPSPKLAILLKEGIESCIANRYDEEIVCDRIALKTLEDWRNIILKIIANFG